MSSVHSTVVRKGRSYLGASFPTEAILAHMKIQTQNQASNNTMAIGGIKKICGVVPTNMAVHFMIAMPILMFFQLQMTQMRTMAAKPQAIHYP